MNSSTSNPAPAAQRREVLTKAVIKAARLLSLSQAQLATAIGVSAPTVSRMASGKYLLNPKAREWEFSSLFVRLFRALDSLVGSDEKARIWLTTQNTSLNAKPVDLLSSAQGLIRVLQYLDAARGRN